MSSSPESSDAPELVSICRELTRRNVRFVLIGGLAAIARGADVLTRDVDVVPDLMSSNLDVLSRTLIALHAEVRFAGPVINTGDGEWLRAAKTWNFDTTAGILDVLLQADGGGDFEALAERAELIPLAPDVSVLVASLDDLIAMKEAAGRPKDLLALPMLRWLRDRESAAK